MCTQKQTTNTKVQGDFMKKALLIGFMVVLNSLAYAAGGGEVGSVGEAKCKEQALEIAKAALSLKAKAQKVTYSVADQSLAIKSTMKDQFGSSSTDYSLIGYMDMNGRYDILINLGTECDLNSVQIKGQE